MTEYEADLEAAKAKMADIEENLKSLTGGRLIIPASRRGGPRGGMRGGGPGRLFASAREEGNANMEPMRKRLRPSLEGRLGTWNRADADDWHDPDMPKRGAGLASAVTVTPRDTKSRDDAIHELEAEEPKEVKSRNRRMFGMLLGTLSGFRKSVTREDKLKEQEKKREAVEKKLEEERSRLREQREADKAALLAQRQEQEEEIFRLQRRRMTTFIAEKEIAHLRLLQPFIQTKAKPPIFYRPKQHSLRTIELQKKTERKLEELIQQKEEKLRSDLAAIDEKNAQYKARIPGLRRETKDEDEEHEDKDPKEPGEVGETIEGAEDAVSGDAKNARDLDEDKDTGEEKEEGEDVGANIIEAINEEAAPRHPEEEEEPAKMDEGPKEEGKEEKPDGDSQDV